MPVDLSAWSDLYRRPGPFSSVHLDVTRDAEDAATVLDIRWRDLRDRLEQQGSPDEDRAALDEVVTMPVLAGGPVSCCSVAGDGKVLDDQVLTGGDNAPGPRHVRPRGRPHPGGAPCVAAAAVPARRGRTGRGRDLRARGRTRAPARPRRRGRPTPVEGPGWGAGDVRAREKVRQSLPTAVVDELVEVDRHTRPEGASAAGDTDHAVVGLGDTIDALREARGLRAGALTGAQVLLVDAEDLPGQVAVAGLVRWEQPA